MQLPRFENPAFTRFWLGETAAVLGYQMMAVAIGWQIYDLTNSALSLGLIGLVQFLPQLLLTPVVGHAADHYDRRRIVWICDLMKGTVAVVLAAGSYANVLDSAGIYACAVLIGTAQAFQGPATRSLLPSLVAADTLAKSVAWSFSARKAAVIVGPALGGLLYVPGASIAYGTAAASYLAAGVLIVGIRVPARAAPKEKTTLDTMLAGITFIRSKPVILGALSLDLFATLLGGVTALLPIYAKDILATGPWGLGLLRAAPAIGALLVSVWLVRAAFQRRVGHIIFAAVAIFGVGTIVFGLSTSLPLSLAALMLLGAADMVSVVIRSTLIQLETPDPMRGRVSAVNAIFTSTSNQVGQFQAGVMAAWLGAVTAVVLGGIGTLLVVALWMRWCPDLVRRQALREPDS